MSRLHHPVTIPGLLSEPPQPGTFLVLDGAGEVNLAGTGVGEGTPPQPPSSTPITTDDIVYKEPWPTGPTSGAAVTFIGNILTIAAGSALIVNSWETPYAPVYDEVTWAEQTIDATLPGAPQAYSFLYLDPAGVPGILLNRPDPSFIRQNVALGRIVHDISTGDVIDFRPAHMIPGGTSQMMADFFWSIGIPILIKGADVVGNTDLTFDTSPTQWFSPGESWQQDKDDPNVANNPGGFPQEFYYMKSNGVLEPAPIRTLVLPDTVEDTSTNTVLPISGSPNQATIQRLWTSISGTYVMTYGQTVYPTLEEARNSITSDNATFIIPPYLAQERATLVAYFVMEHTATDLLNGIDVIIIAPEGSPVSGGAAGPHTHDTLYLRLDTNNDPMLADLDMGTQLINNLSDPVSPQDAATKSYVDVQDPHDLYSTRHTDVDVVTPLSDRHVLAVPAGLGDWKPELRMNWRNTWIQGTYYTHDVVRDGDYLMAANKETTDRPSPIPIGGATFLLPDAPAWNVLQYTGSMFSGMHIDVPAGGLYEVQAFRVWVQNTSADAKYQVVIYDAVTGLFNLSATFSGDLLTAPGWLTVEFSPFFISAEDDFYVLVRNSNSAGTTDFNHPWVRGNDSNLDNDPGLGNWNQDNNATRLRMSTTDADTGDRSAELASVVPGTLIQLQDEADLLAYSQFEVIAITDNGTWFLYDVALVDSGVNGTATIGERQQAYFEVPIAAATDYVTLTDHFIIDGAIDGYLSFESVVGGIDTNDGYGIDIRLQQYLASQDWDLMALTGGSGGGTGGEGTNPLPIGGATDQALTKIDDQDYNVEWSGPYLKLTGGTMSGFLTLSAAPTADLHAATKKYVDDQFPVQHGNLGGVLPDQHHARYTDAEAVAAVGPHTPPQTYLHADLTDVNPDQHHTRYTDQEAIDAVGPIPPPQTFLHESLTDVTSSQHHVRYSDAEAVAAGEAHGFWDRADLGPGTPGGGNRQVPVWDTAQQIYVSTPFEASLRIMGTVANEASLPPGPHDIGQAWITDDTGDLWIWGEESDADPLVEGWVNAGPLFTTTHDSLTDVTSDQHHVRYTDAEAQAAVAGIYLPLAGGTMTGNILMQGNKIIFVTGQIDDLWQIKGSAAAGFILADSTGKRRLRIGDGFIDYWNDANDAVTFGWSRNFAGSGWRFYGDVSMQNSKITEVTDPTDPQDAATKAYVDATEVGTKHTISTTAPTSPDVGDVWVDPDAPPEATYLPLTGGTLTGDLNLTSGSLYINNAEVEVFELRGTAAGKATRMTAYIDASGWPSFYGVNDTGGVFSEIKLNPGSGYEMNFNGLVSERHVGWDHWLFGAANVDHSFGVGRQDITTGNSGAGEIFAHRLYLALNSDGSGGYPTQLDPVGTSYIGHANILWIYNQAAAYGRVGFGNGTTMWPGYADGGNNISQIGFAPSGGEVWNTALIGAIEAGWGISSPYLVMGNKRDKSVGTYVSWLYDGTIHSSSAIINDSDERLKRDIREVPWAPFDPRTIRPKKWLTGTEPPEMGVEVDGRYIEPFDEPVRRGFSAQDLAEKLPDPEGVVLDIPRPDGEPMMSVDPIGLTSVLWDIVSDLTGRVEALENG